MMQGIKVRRSRPYLGFYLFKVQPGWAHIYIYVFNRRCTILITTSVFPPTFVAASRFEYKTKRLTNFIPNSNNSVCWVDTRLELCDICICSFEKTDKQQFTLLCCCFCVFSNYSLDLLLRFENIFQHITFTYTRGKLRGWKLKSP